MEYRHIISFSVLAEELHFGISAQKLNITQPALSQYIKGMESELKIQLFKRTNRQVALTDEGRQLLEPVRLLIKNYKNVKDVARSLQAGEHGILKLGYVGSSITDPVLSVLIQGYKKEFGNVKLILEEHNVCDQIALLVDNLLDVAVVRMPISQHEHLKYCTISTCPLIAVLPEDHRLAQNGTIPLASLSSDPFFIQQDPPGVGLGWSTLDACFQAGFTPQGVKLTQDVSTAIGMVSMGMGVTLVPQTQSTVKIPNVTYCQLEGEPTLTTLSLVWSSRTKNKLVVDFIHFVKEILRV